MGFQKIHLSNNRRNEDKDRTQKFYDENMYHEGRKRDMLKFWGNNRILKPKCS